MYPLRSGQQSAGPRTNLDQKAAVANDIVVNIQSKVAEALEGITIFRKVNSLLEIKAKVLVAGELTGFITRQIDSLNKQLDSIRNDPFANSGENMLAIQREKNMLKALEVPSAYEIFEAHEHVKAVLTTLATENVSWDIFPELLEIGIVTNNHELIWTAVKLAMTNKKVLRELEGDFKIDHFTSLTNAILNDLKKLPMNGEIIFGNSLGDVRYGLADPACLSALNNLSHVIPISLQMREIFFDEIKRLPEICPYITHLSCPSISPWLLKHFPKLKSYEDPGIRFKSINEVKGFKESLFPIVISGLNLTEMGDDLTDADLEKLSKDFKDLKNLAVRSNKITSIPFEGLKKIDCQGCTSLTTLNVKNAEWVNCNGCTSLKTLNAENAEWVSCFDCHPDLKIIAPKNCQIRRY